MRGAAHGRDAGAVQGPHLRSVRRLGRHVRAVGKVRRGARRQARRRVHLRAGIKPDDVAAGAHEPRHPRHRREPRRAQCRHLPCRPAPRFESRLHPRQSARQHERLEQRTAAAGCALALRPPPLRAANYAWMQHMVHHLAPTGTAGCVMANGSMSSGQSGEGDIRRALSRPTSSIA